MRYTRYVLLLAAILLVLPFAAALADDEVLLPSDATDPNSPGNKTQQFLPPDDSSEVLIPSQDTTQSKSLSSSSGIGIAPPSGTGEEAAAGYAPVPAADNVPIMKTQILKINVPEPPAQDGADANAFTRSAPGMGIDLADKFSWGDGDINQIQQSLGFSKDDVQQHCHLSMNGLLSTAGGSAAFTMGPYGKHGSMTINDKPQSLTVNPIAMCDAIPLKDNLGTVVQLGKRYVVALSGGPCDAPPVDASHLLIHYNGDGKSSCEYK